MKIQLQQQSVRLRIDEAELAHLLGGDVLRSVTSFGPAGGFSLALQLQDDSHPALMAEGGGYLLKLPREGVLALAARLPSRDGVAWDVPAGMQVLHVEFDVDVRDSIRQRGVARRA
ncbi:MAG: hypothetical protein ACN6RG_15930 [Stenotrophomonas sp.]